jgi:hypothetical protein
MSEADFDFSEGDWEDFGEDAPWSELQWRKYLRGTDRDTARFLSVYNSVKDRPDHLDEAAALMGWNADDISLAADIAGDGPEAFAVDEDGDDEPYTLHRHPVCVVTRALYRYLHQAFEHYLGHGQSGVSPSLCWRYANSLHQAEVNVLLSIQALDLGDFGLAICHLKNSLSALNHSLALLDELEHRNTAFLEAFRREIRLRLFDLRELWLRVMADCRTECQRRRGDES